MSTKLPQLCWKYQPLVESFRDFKESIVLYFEDNNITDAALIMLFLCVILHAMWSGKSLQLLCILPFGMLCFSVSMMFVKIMLAVCMVV